MSPTYAKGRKCGDSLTPTGRGSGLTKASEDWKILKILKEATQPNPQSESTTGASMVRIFPAQSGSREIAERLRLLMGAANLAARFQALKNTEKETMNYNKQDNLNAMEHLANKRWGKFLMSVPPGAPRGYILEDKSVMQIIRIRASQLSKDETCDRSFIISYTEETKVLTVTVTLKKNDQAN